MININKYRKLNIKGAGEIYEAIHHDLYVSIFNINESGLEGNNNLRIQLDAKRRDKLKEISIDSNRQIIILARYKFDEEKFVYIYAPSDHYLLRTFDVRSSVWLSDKSAILDAHRTSVPQYGEEEKGKLTTICFSNEIFDKGVDEILSTMPLLKSFNEELLEDHLTFESKINDLKENEKIKELIGYLGEYIFYSNRDSINIEEKSIHKTLWNYVSGQKYENHDFTVQLDDMSNRFVEIKTSSPSSESHYISNNEVNFMEKNKDNYSLVSIKLNNKFMSLIYSDCKLNIKEIDALIQEKNYDMEIFNGYQEIDNSFNFESKTFSMERTK